MAVVRGVGREGTVADPPNGEADVQVVLGKSGAHPARAADGRVEVSFEQLRHEVLHDDVQRVVREVRDLSRRIRELPERPQVDKQEQSISTL